MWIDTFMLLMHSPSCTHRSNRIVISSLRSPTLGESCKANYDSHRKQRKIGIEAFTQLPENVSTDGLSHTLSWRHILTRCPSASTPMRCSTLWAVKPPPPKSLDHGNYASRASATSGASARIPLSRHLNGSSTKKRSIWTTSHCAVPRPLDICFSQEPMPTVACQNITHPAV